MNVASKIASWAAMSKSGVHVDVEMTASTGKFLRFFVRFPTSSGKGTIDWGDGTVSQVVYTSGNIYSSHTYASYGTYTVVLRGFGGIGFRSLDGQSQYTYDDAIISVVDYSGEIREAPSACFKWATRLKRFIAPNLTWMGQRSFAYCTSLEEVRLGKVGIHYDGSFQGCSALVKYTAESTGQGWSYIFYGCSSIKVLRLGAVSQFATQTFYDTPNLKDIYISDKTMDQVRQIAASGNIVAGYGAKFPWGASSDAKFHCTDGVVRADGTVVG